MEDFTKSCVPEMLFEDQLTLSDGRSRPYPVLLQLTSESLIVRPHRTNTISSLTSYHDRMIAPRYITITRDPSTRSFGFSIKGGSDTGFPILISRVIDSNAHLLNIGDGVLSINDENISNLSHDEVMTKIHDIPGDQINLTVKYMAEMATYLHLTSSKATSLISILQNSSTIPKISSAKIRREQKCRSAEYPSQNHNCSKPRHSSLIPSHQEENEADSTIEYNQVHEYSLLYAYVSQYLNGTDEWRINAFQLKTLDGSETGIFITKTSIQQHMWVSRINMVINNLTKRILSELNQTLLPSEQILYASWVHERIVYSNENHLPEWKAVFIVFKGNDLYIFDGDQSPPLCTYDFICCTRVFPIVKIFIETVPLQSSMDHRPYCFTLILPNDLINECRYLSLERQVEYDEFLSNYQRSLFISVYSIQNRTFGCIYQEQICRFIIDVNKGFEMYNNHTNVLLWTFKSEQLQSSSDNGRDKIYFKFKNDSTSNDTEDIIHIEVQCQHLRILVHVINAFLTVKYIR